MDFHHVVEAAGIVALGLVFYSYARRWLDSTVHIDRRLRALLNGVFFGLLSITLVTLVEGTWAGLIAAIVAAGYRLWMGGSGALAGVLWLLATAGTAALALAWARRDGHVRTRHAFALGGAVFVVTFASFLVLGARGIEMFSRDWLPLLVVSVVGIGGFTRLFTDVANAQVAEAARRESAELRAIALLARAAAHEINNALMVVAGGLAILAKR